jgi:hypothetical protein
VRNTNGMRAFASLLIAVSLNGPAASAEDLQFCWVQGRYDLTIYYAEIEGREDRSKSFAELLRISGIDFDDVHCKTGFAGQERARLFEAWRRRELEVIDTTFMSDLDS